MIGQLTLFPVPEFALREYRLPDRAGLCSIAEWAGIDEQSRRLDVPTLKDSFWGIERQEGHYYTIIRAARIEGFALLDAQGRVVFSVVNGQYQNAVDGLAKRLEQEGAKYKQQGRRG